MATMTFYPDTAVDGYVMQMGGGFPWAWFLAGPGTDSNDAANIFYLMGFSHYGAPPIDSWGHLGRGILLFDTSPLPDTAIISGAVLSIYGESKLDQNVANPSVNIYSSNPASNIALVGADYVTVGDIPFSTPIAYAAWSVLGYNDFILNAAGIAAISRTGVSKFSTRDPIYDVGALTPPIAGGGLLTRIFGYTSEQGGGFRPRLVVTYLVPPPVTPPSVVTLPATGVT